MSRPNATTLPAILIDRVIDRSVTRTIGIIVGASLLIALSAKLSVPVPFSPVPMTMQPLAVLLVGAALGAKRGAAAAGLYLLEGAAGFPVFAHPLGLAGPTAGYLLAFPLGAGIAGALAERGWTRTIAGTVAAMSLALAVILLGGWSWLSAGMQLGARGAFLAGVAPFLPGDAMKVVIAAAVLPLVQRILNSRP